MYGHTLHRLLVFRPSRFHLRSVSDLGECWGWREDMVGTRSGGGRSKEGGDGSKGTKHHGGTVEINSMLVQPDFGAISATSI